MNKNPKKSKSPEKPKSKIKIKDLKAKDAGSVKGGIGSGFGKLKQK